MIAFDISLMAKLYQIRPSWRQPKRQMKRSETALTCVCHLQSAPATRWNRCLTHGTLTLGIASNRRARASPFPCSHDENQIEHAEPMFDRALTRVLVVVNVYRDFGNVRTVARHLEPHFTFDREPVEKHRMDQDA